jgi:hypothetical protein
MACAPQLACCQCDAEATSQNARSHLTQLACGQLPSRGTTLLLMPVFLQVDAAAVLQPLLKHAWTLWQLLITAQPLMVVGLTPRCGTAVGAQLR